MERQVTNKLEPKTEVFNWGNHKITIRYNPDSPDAKHRWEWKVDIRRTFTYAGRAHSLEQAKTEGEAALFARAGL